MSEEAMTRSLRPTASHSAASLASQAPMAVGISQGGRPARSW